MASALKIRNYVKNQEIWDKMILSYSISLSYLYEDSSIFKEILDEISWN